MAYVEARFRERQAGAANGCSDRKEDGRPVLNRRRAGIRSGNGVFGVRGAQRWCCCGGTAVCDRGEEDAVRGDGRSVVISVKIWGGIRYRLRVAQLQELLQRTVGTI